MGSWLLKQRLLKLDEVVPPVEDMFKTLHSVFYVANMILSLLLFGRAPELDWVF